MFELAVQCQSPLVLVIGQQWAKAVNLVQRGAGAQGKAVPEENRICDQL